MPSTNPPDYERPRVEPSEFELREGEPVRVDLVVGDRRLPVIVELTGEDHVEMYLADPEQAWFWTEEWLAGEREADEDAAEERLRRYDDPDDFLRSFGSMTSANVGAFAPTCESSECGAPPMSGR